MNNFRGDLGISSPSAPREISQLTSKLHFSMQPFDSTLDETVHVRPPDGYNATVSRYIRRLYIALFRLRQAPLAWYTELRNKRCELSFTVSNPDPFLIVLQSADGSVLALIYVLVCLFVAESLSHMKPIVHAIPKIWELGGQKP